MKQNNLSKRANTRIESDELKKNINSYSYNKKESIYDNFPEITAKSWCIIDGEKGHQLSGQKVTEQREIASLTKTMTLLLCFKLVKRFNLNPNQLYFSVSNTAASTKGTTANLEEGEWLLVWDLYHGLMLPSGNDAAMCLAENFGCLLYFNSIGKSDVFADIHSVDVIEDIYVKDYLKLFIQEMNKLAKELDLKNTQFANPHGLANFMNKSTSLDQAKLTFYALQFEDFRKIVSKQKYKSYIKYVEDNDEVTESQIMWENTNKLLEKPGWYGCKTGITKAAGSCLSSWYNSIGNTQGKPEVNIIIIVLGCNKQQNRFIDTEKIANWWVSRVVYKQEQEQEKQQQQKCDQQEDQSQ